MQRAVAVPIPSDNIAPLTATSGHLYYLTHAELHHRGTALGRA